MFNLFPDFQTQLVYVKKDAKIALIKASGSGVVPGSIVSVLGDHVRPNSLENALKSAATETGPDGNIRELTEDEPVWQNDFLLNSCPELTLLPQEKQLNSNFDDLSALTPVNVTTPAAGQLRETVANDNHFVFADFTGVIDKKYYYLIICKSVGGRNARLADLNGEGSVTVNLATGAVIAEDVEGDVSVYPMTNSRYMISMAFTRSASTLLRIALFSASGGLSIFPGDVTKGLDVEYIGVHEGEPKPFPILGALTRVASSFTFPGLQTASVFATGFSKYIDLSKYFTDGNDGTIMSYQKSDGSPVLDIKALDGGITIYDPVAEAYADSEIKTTKGILTFDGQRVKLLFNGAKQIDYLCPAPAVIDKLAVAAAGNYFSFNHLLFSNIALPEAVAIQHVPAL